MAHHYHAQVPLGFGQGLALRGGLQNDTGFVLVLVRQVAQPQRVEHHQATRQGQGLLGLCVVGDVAVEVGAGQDQPQTPRPALSVPRSHRVGRATGVQG